MDKILKKEVGFTRVPWNHSYVDIVHFSSVNDAYETINTLYGIQWINTTKNLNFKYLKGDVFASVIVDFDQINGDIEQAFKYNYMVVKTTYGTEQSNWSTYKFYFILPNQAQVPNARTCLRLNLEKDVFTSDPGLNIKGVLTDRLHCKRFRDNSSRSHRDYDLSADAPAAKPDVLDSAFKESRIFTAPRNLTHDLGEDFEAFDGLRWAYILLQDKFDLSLGGTDLQEVGYTQLKSGSFLRPYTMVCIPIYGTREVQEVGGSPKFVDVGEIYASVGGNTYNFNLTDFLTKFLQMSSDTRYWGVVSDIPPFDPTVYLRSCKYVDNGGDRLDVEMVPASVYNSQIILQGFKRNGISESYKYAFQICNSDAQFEGMTEDSNSYRGLGLLRQRIRNIGRSEPKLLNKPYCKYVISEYSGLYSELNIFDCGFRTTDGILDRKPTFRIKGPYFNGGDGLFYKNYITSGIYENAFESDQSLYTVQNISPLPALKDRFIEYCSDHLFSIITGQANNVGEAFSTGKTGSESYIKTYDMTKTGSEEQAYNINQGYEIELISEGNTWGNQTLVPGEESYISSMSEVGALKILRSAIGSLTSMATASIGGPTRSSNSNLLVENDSDLTNFSYFTWLKDRDLKIASDFYFKFGYQVDRITSSDEWFTRTVFNFVKLKEDCSDKMGTYNSPLDKEIISKVLQSGTTFWEKVALQKDIVHPFVYPENGMNWEYGLVEDETDPYWGN